MPALLDRRLVVVTGKGGVGKTTVAAALGLLAARARQARPWSARWPSRSGWPGCSAARDVGHSELELAPGLFAVSVSPSAPCTSGCATSSSPARSPACSGTAASFGYLTAAAPGVTELVTMGKVWDLAQPERRTGGSSSTW